MLTRIEIDGFKSFEGFELELGPFGLVVGPNAAGKSNLFDAIRLLSKLSGTDLRTAVQEMRGEADDLRRQIDPRQRADRMRFAVEVLVDPVGRDPWGAPLDLKHTRLRYDLELEHRRDDRGVERLVVRSERAAPILRKDDRWRPFGLTPSRAFREAYLRYSRKVPLLETVAKGGHVSFKVRQDGNAGRERPADAPEATVLSSITTAEFPHLFALREEMRSWRFLQLDPGALRQPSPIMAPQALESSGSNLAAVLARIRAETREDDEPQGALADISAELASIIPGVVDVDVEEDDHTREFRAFVRMRDGYRFPTRVVSDGTLRVLALLALLYDPRHRGLVCFEEPENGVHPARLQTLIGRLRELVSDPTGASAASAEPLSQLLMNSHSPVVLGALGDSAAHAGQVFFADQVTVVDPGSDSVRRKTRIRPVARRDQGDLQLAPGAADQVTSFEVQRYLETAHAEG